MSLKSLAFLVAPTFAAFSFLWAASFPAVRADEPTAEKQNESAAKPTLDELVKIAEADGSKVFTICEICDGESRTATVRPATRCHNSYSVAKLFTTICVGILEDRGLLDVDEPIYPIFSDYFPADFDPKWKDVKISDVLRHRVGFGTPGFLDIDAENSANWGTDDFLRLVLSQELKYKPGEEYVYTDAAFYLASRIVTEKCGERLDDFMIRELLAPMKFAEYAFAKCPQGYPIGATGLYISSEDMAKLGRLLVDGGVYEGRRLVSQRFVDKAFERNFELYPVGDSGDAFGKGGMNGQFLYMNRKTKRVVALHSFNADVGKILNYVVENDK